MKADPEFIELLRSTKTVRGGSPRLTHLTGGVSSEIHLVEDGDRRFVIKRALEKLKVSEDWFADTSRNRAEEACLRYVGGFLPEAVPAVISSHPEHGFFTMVYLGEGFTNWKQRLLAGDARVSDAEAAGRVLGEIHRHSSGCEDLSERFNPLEVFHQLRLDPYLVRTAARHPDLAERIHEEVDRLASACDCLVHGDYSPKNILISDDRLVVLDCEVAWMGDGAFDTAFLLNHFYLKCLHHHPVGFDLEGMVSGFWKSYTASRGGDPEIESRTVRLLPMLLLARVDGKSPVEYLTDPAKREFVRGFARSAILEPESGLNALTIRWREALERLENP